MSLLKKITLTQYKNYPSSIFEFGPTVNCISGRNGSGKTNILDAVYYLCYTKSYFTSTQQQVAAFGTEGFRIEGIFETDSSKDHIVTCIWRSGKKEVLDDGIAYEQIREHIGRYAAVMIAPDDISYINGSSEYRRKWVDGILAQTDRVYLEHLINYQKLLQQRNAFLKGAGAGMSLDQVQLDYYNISLNTAGNYIYEQRKKFSKAIVPLLTQLYTDISGKWEEITVQYRSDLESGTTINLLLQSLHQDLRFQRTTRGIHKDDWIFELNRESIKQFGSQGQKKSFLFAMKLSQYQYLKEFSGFKAILLLDDVFEKLDETRTARLLKIIQSEAFGQVLLTDTHFERLELHFQNTPFVNHIRL